MPRGRGWADAWVVRELGVEKVGALDRVRGASGAPARGACTAGGRGGTLLGAQEEESRRGDGEADWGEGELGTWKSDGVIRTNIGEGEPEAERNKAIVEAR